MERRFGVHVVECGSHSRNFNSFDDYSFLRCITQDVFDRYLKPFNRYEGHLDFLIGEWIYYKTLTSMLAYRGVNHVDRVVNKSRLPLYDILEKNVKKFINCIKEEFEGELVDKESESNISIMVSDFNQYMINMRLLRDNTAFLAHTGFTSHISHIRSSCFNYIPVLTNNVHNQWTEVVEVMYFYYPTRDEFNKNFFFRFR